ncbi:hypothetical protein [Eleftheria terrae]|uniref:hypothetical protein n=1 Tax=Eleftheria terrae TaxID=1597781 RepID=UPI00263A7987|nr:hypothetical protein [Eleftheria terrae]WKB52789.1 hypothetical protein N7L95_23930 [Eleftheria terrae]
MRHKILSVALVLALLLGLAGAPHGGLTLAGVALLLYGIVAMVRSAAKPAVAPRRRPVASFAGRSHASGRSSHDDDSERGATAAFAGAATFDDPADASGSACLAADQGSYGDSSGSSSDSGSDSCSSSSSDSGSSSSD